MNSFADQVATEFFETLKYANVHLLTVNYMTWEVRLID